NKAYDEAYQIGLQDGFKSAVDQRLKDINQAIDDFQVLVNSIHTIKTDLIYQNEAHIVSTIFRIAEKIAYGHIAENPDFVLPVIRQSIELAQADDEVTVLVSPEQIDFIENLKKLSGRDFDFLKNIRLEPSDKVMSGGCIVETNYGVIDAQVQTRVEKIWTELSQALPKIKKIAG
ncbi:MAG: flagellar assembly protein, partial [Bdellovibrionaceae bacterium]|nr:flagellar assembly protein [Pseudobdellovibrionaceae bacterium]